MQDKTRDVFKKQKQLAFDRQRFFRNVVKLNIEKRVEFIFCSVLPIGFPPEFVQMHYGQI